MGEAPAKRYNPLVVTDKIWTGNTALRMQRGLPLPPRYENARGITLVSAEPMSLTDIANAITQQTGISVRVSQVGTAEPRRRRCHPSIRLFRRLCRWPMKGPLSGLMERVAGYFGVNWRYDGSSISITRFETRVFVIEAMQGTTKADTSVQQSSGGSAGGGGGGGGGSSGGSGGSSGGSSAMAIQGTLQQSAKYSIENKYWDELGQIIDVHAWGHGHSCGVTVHGHRDGYNDP